jgi:hypothetical protein
MWIHSVGKVHSFKCWIIICLAVWFKELWVLCFLFCSVSPQIQSCVVCLFKNRKVFHCLRVKSSGMWWCVVVWVVHNVSKGCSAFIFRARQSMKNFSCTALLTTSPATQNHIPKDTHSYACMHTERSIW